MPFEPISTARLVLRPVIATDVEPLLARRNDPVVALHQNWELPFPRERAEAIIAGSAAMDGPADGEWWMLTVCTVADGKVVGDLGVHLSWEGRTAEIGYTFDSGHWGGGYAFEAVEGLIAWLFTGLGVARVWGMTHPDNRASAMVLERNGLLFEGRTSGSYWVGEENSDDCLYGATRAQWEAWSDRPRHVPAELRLDAIDAGNALAARRLATHHWQTAFVATVEASFADALVPEIVDGAPVVPWMRAIVADGDIAGFVMVAEVTDHHPEPFLWRLLIDRRHQRRGIGRRALDLVTEDLRLRGAATMLTSWVDGKGSPRPFYERYGFVPTGELVDDEVEARVAL